LELQLATKSLPYHVDRGKLFKGERFGDGLLTSLFNPNVICEYIEMTRFCISQSDPRYQETASYCSFVHSSVFIRQLSYCNYLRNARFPFCEFEESDKNGGLDYNTPDNIHDNYTMSNCDVVRISIHYVLCYLKVTQESREWIANVLSHICDLGLKH
jgi:hypothetical protein